jgi:hypothetical protein
VFSAFVVEMAARDVSDRADYAFGGWKSAVARRTSCRVLSNGIVSVASNDDPSM